MKFTQGIRIACSDADALVKLLKEYDDNQASMDIMGFIGSRLLANRDKPGEFLILADFAEVDGKLSAVEEAQRNNDRNETEGWAERLRALIGAEPEWIHYDELYYTGITGNLRTG
jgi:hypothetical protein